MANELQLSASIAYNNPVTTSQPLGRSVSGLQFNSLQALAPIASTISIATTGTAISLGQITSPSYAWFRNLDPVNSVNIWTSLVDKGLGANPFTELQPGQVAMLPLGSGNAPYAKANVAAIDLECWISSQ